MWGRLFKLFSENIQIRFSSFFLILLVSKLSWYIQVSRHTKTPTSGVRLRSFYPISVVSRVDLFSSNNNEDENEINWIIEYLIRKRKNVIYWIQTGYFSLCFWRTLVLFVGLFISLFWASSDICLGFQSKDIHPCFLVCFAIKVKVTPDTTNWI